jgi:hypothetical protein
VYYDSKGQVVQDLVFQFHHTQTGWQWTGFYENPIAVPQIRNYALAPNGPLA